METVATQAKWIELLNKRGIYEGAAECGMELEMHLDRPGLKDGWVYPVYHCDGSKYFIRKGLGILRYKAFDSEAKPKYLWVPDDPKDGQPWELPRYYFPPGFMQAVKENDGDAILASGEPDVWTWVTSGIRNVFCWYGEARIPKDRLVEDLRNMGVEFVHQYPDLDKTGHTSATQVHRILSNGFIKHQIWLLPPELGEGGDINKAWIASGFQRREFSQMLAKCRGVLANPNIDVQEYDPELAALKFESGGGANKAFDLCADYTGVRFWQLIMHSQKYPDPVAKVPTPKPKPNGDDKPFEMPEEYYRAIETALDPGMEFNSDGWSRKPFPCPLTSHSHDAERPAAGWNHDTHVLKCFKCGDAVGAKTVAEALGIDWRVYLPQSPVKRAANRAASAVPAETEPAAIVPMDPDLDIGGTYLAMPFTTIRALGGFAHRMAMGKCTLLGAPSGNHKTTMGECIMAGLRRAGTTVIIFSPEWSEAEWVMRQIQREGGPTFEQQLDHQAYCTELKIGRKSDDVLRAEGKHPMSPEMIELRDEIKARINSWPGKAYWIRAGNFDEVMQQVQKNYEASCAAGAPAELLFFDYLQLAVSPSYEEIMTAARVLKEFSMVNRMHALITSQVKLSGSKLAKNGEALHAEDLEYIKENVFNLVMLVQRMYSEGEHPTPLDYIRVNVVKNSIGGKGEVVLDLNPERMLITDPRPVARNDDFYTERY